MEGLKLQSKSSKDLRAWNSAACVRRARSRCWRTLSSSWRISSKNSPWLRRLAAASCNRTDRLWPRPDRRSCFNVISRVDGFMVWWVDVLDVWGKADGHELVVSFQVADQRVCFQKGQLRARRAEQQLAQIPQAPGSVLDGLLAGALQLGHRMLFRQAQQSVQHTNGLRAARSKHLLGPSAGVFADESRAIQKPVGPA